MLFDVLVVGSASNTQTSDPAAIAVCVVGGGWPRAAAAKFRVSAAWRCQAACAMANCVNGNF